MLLSAASLNAHARLLMCDVPAPEGLQAHQLRAVQKQQRSGLVLLTTFTTGIVVDLQLVNQFRDEPLD